MRNLAPEVADSLAAAGQAVESGQWFSAVQRSREALAAAGRRPPDILKKTLANCLANHAVQLANEAMETVSGGEAALKRLVAQRVSTFLSTPASRMHIPATPVTPAPSPERRPWQLKDLIPWLVLLLPVWLPAFVWATRMASAREALDFFWALLSLWAFVSLVVGFLNWLGTAVAWTGGALSWIRKWWRRQMALSDELLGRAPHQPAPSYRRVEGDPCAISGCSLPASFDIDTRQLQGAAGGGAKRLCAGHALLLQREIAAVSLDRRAAGGLTWAKAELEEAIALDPEEPVFKENLRQIVAALETVERVADPTGPQPSRRLPWKT